MRLPALLKTLLLGITLIAAPALAEDAVPLDANGRVPVGFKGDDAEKIFDAIAKLPNLYKDQFETEAEYQTRMKNFDRNAVTFEGGKNLGSRFAFVMQKSTSKLGDSYDPEKKMYDARGTSIISASANVKRGERLIVDFLQIAGFATKYTEIETGTYTGSNAFGAQVNIEKRKSDWVLVGRTYKTSGGLDESGYYELYRKATNFSLPAEKAREAIGGGVGKTNTRMVVIGTFKPPFVERGWKINKPTMDYPVDRQTEVKALMINIEEIWVYNEQNGEIYNKVKVNSR
jgi:hypothetical protein